jgi:tripartite-type tricarboxylate transporter receptor subunit TctC
MRRVMTILARAGALGAALMLADAARAQTYPARPVKVIVPIAPAGPADVLARLITQKLSNSLGQQFYVENQAGAGGNLGMGAAARAVADGYTVALVSTSFVVNPSLYPKIPYDPFKDFTPVTLIAVSPNVLVVHPSIPVQDVGGLIGFLRANPGKYSFASAGLGTTPHLSGEFAGRVRRAHQGRNPEMGGGDPGGEHQAAVDAHLLPAD